MVTIRTMRWCARAGGAVVAAVALSGGAAAAPGAAPDDALGQARKLAAAGKHAEAVAAFEQAVQAHPDDAVAQAELGFEAYLAKDYPRAEAATRAAIARAPAPAHAGDPASGPRGAALYNLGLILEATHRPNDAAAAYADSLAVRPSRVVRSKLQKLDPEAAARHDPLAPQPLAGPFASLAAACEDERAHAGSHEGWDHGASCARPPRIAIAGKPRPPFDELVAYSSPSQVDLQLVIRIGSQWYRSALADDSDYTCFPIDFKVTRLGQVKRAVPELRIEYTETSTCDHGGNGHDREYGLTAHGVVVIGVGPSGKPSGLPPLITGAEVWQRLDGGSRERVGSGLTLTWAPTGALEVGGKPPELKEGASGGAEIWLGRHLLTFP